MSEEAERPKSYQKINYSLRPAKAIERRMLVEALQRLHVFSPLQRYRYIGFGSTFFSDFSLFHKALGITNMVSLEHDTESRSRFEFNRPYDCIQIEFIESTAFLAATSWKERTILWLDYDGKLEEKMLTDIKYACMNAGSGSVVMISVNAHPDNYDPRDPEARLNAFGKRVGSENLPIDVKAKDLRDWGTAVVCHRIISNVISTTVRERNGVLNPGSRIRYRQLFNIRYADGARMLTVGGLLYDESSEVLVDMCAFENLSFSTNDEQACHIEVPSLTFKEMRHLDKKLPANNHELLIDENLSLSLDDLKRYASLYRYFPAFAETNL